MRLRYKTALAFIMFLIIGCGVIGVSYLFYEKVIKDNAVVIVSDNITINFLNGDEFQYKKDAEMQFSVTNNGEEEAYYYIGFADVEATETLYTLTSSNNDIDIKSTLTNSTLTSYIAISPNQTQNYELKFTNEDSKTYSGKIIVGVEFGEEETFAETLLKNNKYQEITRTKFNENATGNEGLIKNSDDYGTSYYYRGNIKNNYVSFADLNWRIVKINGDGSVKLVLDKITEEISPYYEENETNFETSKINKYLLSWYDLYLSNYSDYIANHKFCNDKLTNEETEYYAAYDRVLVNFIPNTVCLGETVFAKIGLLTADEVAMAGATSSDNMSYYLYNDDIETDYYLMTSAKKSSSNYYPFIVDEDGGLKTDTNGTLLRGVRPVINIIKNTKVLGTGTVEDPYTLNF